jgi:signal peptidase I
VENDLEHLRADAARRSWFCPGAGFALLGRARLAVATYFVALGSLGALAWVIIQPGPAALWTTAGAILASTGLWLAEQVAARKLQPQPPKPTFLVAGFRVAGAIGYLAAGLSLVLFFSRFGSVQLGGAGMASTIEQGERVLYEKRIDPAHLRAGTVVIYRLSDRSDWGAPGLLVVSRIIAVPGDRVSVRNGKYVVNGKESHPVAETGQHTPVIQVPSAPETLILGDGRYFVVQESPTEGLDSRVLSWVERGEILSTELYLMSGRGILKRVH